LQLTNVLVAVRNKTHFVKGITANEILQEGGCLYILQQGKNGSKPVKSERLFEEVSIV
jgi:hypothetical protein